VNKFKNKTRQNIDTPLWTRPRKKTAQKGKDSGLFADGYEKRIEWGSL